MSEQVVLYPRKKYYRDKSGRRFRVKYDLVYDGGSAEWDGYYRTYWGARVAAWWHQHFSSWGGTAILIDRKDG